MVCCMWWLGLISILVKANEQKENLHFSLRKLNLELRVGIGPLKRGKIEYVFYLTSKFYCCFILCLLYSFNLCGSIKQMPIPSHREIQNSEMQVKNSSNKIVGAIWTKATAQILNAYSLKWKWTTLLFCTLVDHVDQIHMVIQIKKEIGS